MSLTARDIAEIARLLDESKFSSLSLEMGDFKLRIRRDHGGWEPETEARPVAEAAAAVPPPAPSPSSSAGAGEVDVVAPLLGNFFSAPRPGDPPFVVVGDMIGEDTTIGIIEVMKLMNPIRARVAGRVVAILAADGSAVEQGQPLIRVAVG